MKGWLAECLCLSDTVPLQLPPEVAQPTIPCLHKPVAVQRVTVLFCSPLLWNAHSNKEN